jgi:hypothetical protein
MKPKFENFDFLRDCHWLRVPEILLSVLSHIVAFDLFVKGYPIDI